MSFDPAVVQQIIDDTAMPVRDAIAAAGGIPGDEMEDGKIPVYDVTGKVWEW